MEYLKNFKAKNSMKSAKQLLMIERSICEYDLLAQNDTSIHNYFDLLAQLSLEIDSKSLMQIESLKTEIFKNVSE